MSRAAILGLAIVALALFGDACTRKNDALLCVPGDQHACACPGGGMGAQRCLDDSSGYDTCLGCVPVGVDLAGADLTGADLAGVDLAGDDLSASVVDMSMGVHADMAHRDMFTTPVDLRVRHDFSTGAGPDLAGVDFTGIACGAATCAVGGACCVTPSNSAPTRTCVAGTTCTMGSFPLLCDGAEDCSSPAQCCITVTNMGSMQSTSGSACNVTCPGQLGPLGGAGNGITTKLCHGSADCVGYTGTAPVVGNTAFDKCCTNSANGVHFCAPGFITLSSPRISCN